MRREGKFTMTGKRRALMVLITGIAMAAALVVVSMVFQVRSAAPPPPGNVAAAPPPPYPSDSSASRGLSLELVDGIVRNLNWGSVAFNAPDSMTYQHPQIVEFLLSPSLPQSELQAQLHQRVGAEAATVRIANRMEATLTGWRLGIQALSPELQAIGSQQTTRWRWEVTPVQHGEAQLHLVLSAHVDVAGSDAPFVVRTFDRSVQVHITPGQRASDFFQHNWQWLWAALLVPIAGYLWRQRKKRGAPTSADVSNGC